MRLIVVAVLAWLIDSASAAPSVAAPPSKTAPSACDDASRRIFGRLPARFTPSGKAAVSEPKTVRRVNPKLPPKWPKECKGTVSVHEALIAPTGKIEQVFALKSPCAELDRAASGAIAQWEYTPTLVEGKAVPACITITTLVHLR
jgi:hypothetical protein